ncbi:M23 family metallopeptidase [Desmospora profundinema]|uniref:M23ase beta-sheet core domain-containing protein n=1 Tax=Desmospora profundinema TaxID=1571184 RepID=A0ABU1IMU4_9BACL|nr:M23 family metallopeptidase [Desmospora profundinema]MDR6226107.1 hypothetical protein [Desmospora profundinema]
MNAFCRKATVAVVSVCLLSGCGGLYQGRPETPPQQTRHQADPEARPAPVQNADQVFTQTEFIMPIKEQWWVFWGGTNVRDNYHYAYESQRYAFDLVIRRNGRTYTGNKARNESYYAFGKEVIAPARGEVTQVESGIPDNVPVGRMNPRNPFGNYVMIDHGNNEYSVIAHLKKGSLQVSEGQTVEQGELIGLCGNSGNSSEPHIHFHVANTPELNQGQSIRIRLRDNENPVRGDYVQPATPVDQE